MVVGLLAIVASMLAQSGKGEVRGGGVIIVGPVPIVFGSDVSAAKWLLVLATALTLSAALLFLVLRGWLG